MPTKLILIRHGQTTFSAKKRYGGLIDARLNNKGKLQAQNLYRRLKKEVIHKIYTSDKKRSIQTAKIIFKKMQITIMPDLKEINFGSFEGLTHNQVLKRYPNIYRKWLCSPFKTTIPKGESLICFRKRVLNVFGKIISNNRNKTICIISHGGPISIFITNILKSRDFWNKIPKLASISIVEYKNNKAKIELLNNTSHLNE